MVAIKRLPTDVTAAECRRIFAYDRASGVLLWREAGPGRRVGRPAGGTRKCKYRQVHVKGRLYQVHRLIWLYVTGEWPTDLLDHEDRNPMNCRFENLREADHSTNGANRSIGSNNRSGIKGVHQCQITGKWKATVYFHGRQIYLGSFSKKQDAGNAYATAARKYFGEYHAP